MPYLQAIAKFRDEVRKLAKEGASGKDILGLADKLRDTDLTSLGVLLEDQEDGSSLVKLVPAEQLLAQRAEREKAAAAKEAKKRENAEKERLKRQQQLEKGRYPLESMFRESPAYKDPSTGKSLFSEFDDSGMPSKDAEGQEVSKSKRKAYEKDRKAQEKLHKAFLEAKEKGEIA